MVQNYYNVDKVLYVIIAVIGVPVNLVAIVILSRGKCGLSTCTTRYLVAMAAGDLLVIINEVILFRINIHYFPWCFLHLTSICSLTQILTNSSTELSVWFTVAFTFDRFVAICSPKLKTKYCTGKIAAVVISVISIFICLKNVPHYFTQETWIVIDNVPWGCRLRAYIFQQVVWLAWDWFATFLSPLLPFAIILLLNALTVRHILVANRARNRLMGQNKGENRSDPEMESRRRSIILLVALSATFILLWLTTVIDFFYSQATGPGREGNDAEFIFNNVGHLLRNLSCCTNMFIYAVTQTKFREQVKNAVTYPVRFFSAR